MDLATPAEIRVLVAEAYALAARTGRPEDAAAAQAFEALATVWDATMRTVFRGAADEILALGDDPTDEEVRRVVAGALLSVTAVAVTSFVTAALGPFLAAVLQAPAAGSEIAAALGVAYGGPDRRTEAWVRRHETYWVTRFGERILEPRIARIVERVAGEGGGERGTADALSDALGKEFEGSLRYWRLVATAATSRAGAFGRIDVLERAGRDGRLDGTDDERQSEVCDYLDGRVVPLVELVAWREAMFAAATPEEVLRVDPWWQDADVAPGGRLRRMVERARGDVPREAGPAGNFHPHCRTILVAGPRAEERLARVPLSPRS